MYFRFKSRTTSTSSGFVTTVRHASLQWSLKTSGLPHTSRPLKAIAGDGFDANVCADVYNFYVTRINLRSVHFPRWQLIYRSVDSGLLSTNISSLLSIQTISRPPQFHETIPLSEANIERNYRTTRRMFC
jgi:hypothetical protein